MTLESQVQVLVSPRLQWMVFHREPRWAAEQGRLASLQMFPAAKSTLISLDEVLAFLSRA